MTTDPIPNSVIRTGPGTALTAMPAVVGLLAAGVLLDEMAAAAVATAAAVTVGFGAFKRVSGSFAVAMGLVAAGMGVSALVGTLAGQAWEAMVAVVLLWGFGTGLFPIFKSDLAWVAQQCTIVMLVAGAFPGSVAHAADRAALVLGGSGLQFVCVTALVRLFGPAPVIVPPGWAAASRTVGVTLAAEIRSGSATVGRAVRLAVVLAVAVELWRWFHWRNGYWLGMTVLLLVRPGFRDTVVRAGERVLGTLVGAVLATLLIHALPLTPSPWEVAGLVVVFAFLALMLQQGNTLGSRTLTYPGSYTVFAGCLTAYIVFLLDYGNLSPRGVAEERVLLTLYGGVLALAVHIPLDALKRPAVRPESQAVG